MSVGASATPTGPAPQGAEPLRVSGKAASPLRCSRCRKQPESIFYQGKRQTRCGCHSDYRTPIEKRRDVILNKYGNDPAAYTPKVLAALAKKGLLDLTNHFCPAGKLSMEETRKREAASLRGDTA